MNNNNINKQNNQALAGGNINSQNGQIPSRPISIQPSHATQLVQALKNEIALAKAAGNDNARAQKHYAKAENIKQILLNYQAQQKARMQQQQQQQMNNTQSSSGNQSPVINLQQQNRQISNQGTPQDQSPNIPQQPLPQSSPPSQQSVRQSPASSSSTPNVQMSNNNPVTIENFNQVKTRLSEFGRRIQELEESKEVDSSPEQVTAIERELTELKTKYTKYQKYAIYMKNQLLEQAKANNASATAANSAQLNNIGNPNIPNQQDPRLGVQQQQNSRSPIVQNKPIPTSQPIPSQQSQDNTRASNTPQTSSINKTGKSVSPSATNASTMPNKLNQSPYQGPPPINLSGITKPSVSSIPISSTINVKPPTAITLKPNSNNARATLTGGVANGIGSILGSPAITKLPTYDLSTTGSGGAMPDNGGRVLTKRKLSELVNTIGADEGDGKTNIDGDVEELLLDLADEFITSVTGFACRLAKHRKVNTIDVRDVQLHLERNWNIRVPGYAMDEIRATRKWQPSSSYNQKLSGVEISKSVNGNIN